MILILVPIWQRPEITKIWALGMQNFLTGNAEVLCILSREDPFFNENLDIVHRSGFKYCFFQNKPLGQKLNAGIEYALETFNFDFLMNLGSDDLIHPAIWSLYEPMMKDFKFFGLDKVYYYELSSGKLGLTVPYVWGAGRMIHREILELVRAKGQFLYKGEYARGLDCNSLDNIKSLLNITYVQVATNDFPYLVDIKSDLGINDFTMLAKFYTLVDKEILGKYYPKNIIQQLYG